MIERQSRISGRKLPASRRPSPGQTSQEAQAEKPTSLTMWARTSQGASPSQAIAAPSAMLNAERSPIITPVESRSGLQLIPTVSALRDRPPMAPAMAVVSGMICGRPSRNQVTVAATSAPPIRNRARRTALARAAKIVSIRSPVAFPVGNGRASSTTSLRRSNVAATMPTSAMASPQTQRAQAGKSRPSMVMAGTGPPTPAT